MINLFGDCSMAIMTEFINFIVPIKTIEEKYPGGWMQCKEDYVDSLWGRVWYDDHLFRDGAMNPMDMKDIVEDWEGMGFILFDEVDGKKHWKDVCVYEGMLGGATLPCSWLEEDRKNRSVALRGAEICKLAGPNRD